MIPETQEQRAKALCYVAYCPDCDLIYGAAVQIKGEEKETAKFITPWIREGHRIATITAAEVRAAEWCKCNDSKQRDKTGSQAELALDTDRATPQRAETPVRPETPVATDRELILEIIERLQILDRRVELFHQAETSVRPETDNTDNQNRTVTDAEAQRILPHGTDESI